MECDVLVAGGGVAGTLAAVAASRGGCRTVLVEQENYLGGTGYAGMFRQICGLYLNGESPPTDTLNKGIVSEVVRLLGKEDPSAAIMRTGQVYVLSCGSEILQSVLRSLCERERYLVVRNNAAVASVNAENGSIRSATIGPGSDGEEIHPSVAIDATGDGAIAVLSGAASDLASPEENQLAGYTVQVEGLKEDDDALSVKVPYHLAGAVDGGVLDPVLRFTTFSPGGRTGEGYLKLSIDGQPGSERNERARKAAIMVHRYLAEVLPAFGGSSIVRTSPKVIDREGRRIRGEYTLTEQDVLEARKFPDGVVKNAWPVELWDRKKGTIYRYVPRGDYYEVPLRCMIVKDFANLLTTGRCISATHEALGSTRVMGTCMALGEQAGMAAARYVKKGSYRIA